MPPLSRRRLLIAVPLAALLLFAAAALLLTRGHDLKSRSALIAVGMPRERTEGILGRPALVLRRQDGKGAASVWIDQFWQVMVVSGPDGRAETVACVPSDSLYRRTVGRVVAFPK